MSEEWLTTVQEGIIDATDSSESESPPSTSLLISMRNDDCADIIRDESPPAEETFEHQFDSDISEGNCLVLLYSLTA